MDIKTRHKHDEQSLATRLKSLNAKMRGPHDEWWFTYGCDAFQNYWELWQTLSHCKGKVYNELSTTAQVLIAWTLETSTVHQSLF